MFTPFYHSLIRKYVVLMGTTLNNIKISKMDSSGEKTSYLKVPVSYSPKDKMLARVIQDKNLDRQSATIPLPMISFEIVKIQYDPDRKLPTINRTYNKVSDQKQSYQYNPVAYNISFKVYVYSKNVEDGTKIVEQILPYYTPDWTTTCELIPEMNVVQDIPIILTNVEGPDDKYSGEYVDRRTIIWTFDFLLKGYFYGPVKKSNIIRFVDTNFYIPNVPEGQLQTAVGETEIEEKLRVRPGVTANNIPVNWYGKPNNTLDTLPYTEIDVNMDFGYINEIFSKEDLANE